MSGNSCFPIRRELKSEIEDLQSRIAEKERSTRQDASALRDIMGGRMVELATMLRDAEAHNVECQKIMHRQAQLMNVRESILILTTQLQYELKRLWAGGSIPDSYSTLYRLDKEWA